MFKKRTRPASVRDKAPEHDLEQHEDVASGSTSDAGDVEGTEGQSIEDLILLRKLRRAQQGINLEKLNRGEDKKRRKPELELDKFGLQHTSHPSRKDDNAPEDDAERAKRLVRSNNFTQQTNALDVDKHMMAWIEAEMAKRKGEAANGDEEQEEYDPQAELYRLAERYRVEVAKKGDDEEGNVTNSLGMLSAIPEFDLGMENRLKNIEETEKAKREMLESRKAQQGQATNDDETFASARFFRPPQRTQDIQTQMESARREAAGEAAPAPRPPSDRPPRVEMSTDEAVYERFKKRMKR